MDCRGSAFRHSGRDHEHPQLPAAGMFKRPDRGFLQRNAASAGRSAGAGLGRPDCRAAGGLGRNRIGQKPGESCAGSGQLCLGRFRCGVRPGRSVFPWMEKDDARRRTCWYGDRCRHRGGLETIRLVRSL